MTEEMTETEWLTSDNSDQMLYSIAEKASLRKLRLVQVTICRRVAHLLVDERSRFALEVCEAYAEGTASEEALTEARALANAVYSSLPVDRDSGWNPIKGAAYGVVYAAEIESRLRMQIDMIDMVLFAPKPPPESIPLEVRARQLAEADIVRDVFGNPFRPVAFNPAWRTEHTVGIASKIYDDRDFRAMPILADAIEEAGCDNADVLAHCREPGPHARGCWVVDGVLGKR